MSLKDLTQLTREIDAAVRASGSTLPGKTTAPGLNALLRSLATELTTLAGEVALRPVGGVAHRKATVLTFEQDAEYDPITKGTFTVDDRTKRIGAVVTAYLGPEAQEPKITGDFQSRDAYVPGKNLMYMFKVGANDKIQYTISELD